jgi:hypothetical protein
MEEQKSIGFHYLQQASKMRTELKREEAEIEPLVTPVVIDCIDLSSDEEEVPDKDEEEVPDKKQLKRPGSSSCQETRPFKKAKDSPWSIFCAQEIDQESNQGDQGEDSEGEDMEEEIDQESDQGEDNEEKIKKDALMCTVEACKHSTRVYASKRTLYDHIKTHSQVKVQCTECPREFVTRFYCQHHLQAHGYCIHCKESPKELMKKMLSVKEKTALVAEHMKTEKHVNMRNKDVERRRAERKMRKKAERKMRKKAERKMRKKDE